MFTKDVNMLDDFRGRSQNICVCMCACVLMDTCNTCDKDSLLLELLQDAHCGDSIIKYCVGNFAMCKKSEKYGL